LNTKRVLFLFFLIFSVGCYALEATEANSTKQDVQGAGSFSVFTNKLPAQLKLNEVFAIKLNATSSLDENSSIQSSLSNHRGLKLLNPGYKWISDQNSSSKLNLLFKVTDYDVKLPDIQTTLLTNENAIESVSIEGREIAATAVIETPKYCKVIASSMEITNYKIDDYDAANNILAIDISAKYANLEDFKLKNINIQGVNTIKNSYESGKMFYYLIIPNTQKILEFEYFDREENTMKNIFLELDLSNIEEKVSTQTDLQPKSSDKAIYVFLTVAVIASILYGIYYFKREKIFLFLILATILSGVVFLFIPNEQVKIKKDTVVYLLPTENSTPFFKASSDIPVEKLKESEGYVKIKMEDGKIGWVRGDGVVAR